MPRTTAAITQSVNVYAPSGWQVKQVEVGITAVQLDAVPLASRLAIEVAALADNAGKVYIGHDNTVTATTGRELEAGASVEIAVDDSSAVWAIADTAAQRVSVTEVAK